MKRLRDDETGEQKQGNEDDDDNTVEEDAAEVWKEGKSAALLEENEIHRTKKHAHQSLTENNDKPNPHLGDNTNNNIVKKEELKRKIPAYEMKYLWVMALRHHTPLLGMLNKEWNNYFKLCGIDWNQDLIEWRLFDVAPTALIRVNFHPRDKHIFFDEDLGHRYTLVRWDDRIKSWRWTTTSGERTVFNAKGLFSKTTFIGALYAEFDTKEAIRLGRNGRNSAWYVGKTDEEVAAIWQKIKEEASAAGTLMHFYIECYYNGEFHLIDTTTKEWALFLQFEELYVKGKLKPFRSEMRFYNSKLRMCGSVDMLYEYISDQGKPVPVQVPVIVDGVLTHKTVMKRRLVMYDWKRSKEIKNDNPFQKGCVYLTEFMDDCNRKHYDMQLTGYKIMAEAEYDYIICERYLLILHPQQLAPLRIEVTMEKRVEQAMIGHRLTELHWDKDGERSALLPPVEKKSNNWGR